VGDIDQRVDDIERFGRRCANGRQAMPVLELIADVAQSKRATTAMPLRVEDDVVRTYLTAARRHRARCC
jgi:hypothetical protein